MSITNNTSMIEDNNSIIQTIKTKLQNYTPGSGGGSSSDSPVKLFSSVSAMHSSTGNNINDLGVVYRQDMGPMAQDSKLETVNFPDTVILDTAITDSVYGYLYDDDESWENRHMVMLSATSFEIRDDMTYSTVVSYTSSNGKNYTKSEGTSPYTFSAPLHFNGTWNDAFGKFILCKIDLFGGLFNYEEAITEYKASKMSTITISNNQLQASDDNIIIDKTNADAQIKAAAAYILEEYGLGEYGGDYATIMLKDANTLAVIAAEGGDYAEFLRRMCLYVTDTAITGLRVADDQTTIGEYLFNLTTGEFITKNTYSTDQSLGGVGGTYRFNDYYLLSYLTSGAILQSNMYCFGVEGRKGSCYNYSRPQYIPIKYTEM